MSKETAVEKRVKQLELQLQCLQGVVDALAMPADTTLAICQATRNKAALKDWNKKKKAALGIKENRGRKKKKNENIFI